MENITSEWRRSITQPRVIRTNLILTILFHDYLSVGDNNPTVRKRKTKTTLEKFHRENRKTQIVIIFRVCNANLCHRSCNQFSKANIASRFILQICNHGAPQCLIVSKTQSIATDAVV